MPKFTVSSEITASGTRPGYAEDGLYEFCVTTAEERQSATGSSFLRIYGTVTEGHIYTREGEVPFRPSPAGHLVTGKFDSPDTATSDNARKAREGEIKALAHAMGNALKDLRVYDESDPAAKEYMDYWQQVYTQWADIDFINAYGGEIEIVEEHLLWEGARFYCVFEKPRTRDEYPEFQLIADRDTYLSAAANKSPVRWRREDKVEAKPNDAGPSRLGTPSVAGSPAKPTPAAKPAQATQPKPAQPAQPASTSSAKPTQPTNSGLPPRPAGFTPGTAQA